MSKYDGDACVASVFGRADQLMYDNKILVTHLAKHERTLEEYYIELLGRGA